jgi:hypothetical protein
MVHVNIRSGSRLCDAVKFMDIRRGDGDRAEGHISQNLKPLVVNLDILCVSDHCEGQFNYAITCTAYRIFATLK